MSVSKDSHLGLVIVALCLGIVIVFIGAIVSSTGPRNEADGFIVLAAGFLPLLYAGIRGVKSKTFRRVSLAVGFGFGTLCLILAIVIHQKVTRPEGGGVLFILSPDWYQAAEVIMVCGLAAWLYGIIVLIAAAIRVWSKKQLPTGIAG